MIQTLLTALITVFIGINIAVMSLTFGKVMTEKFSNRRTFFDILEDFWIKVWNKIL